MQKERQKRERGPHEENPPGRCLPFFEAQENKSSDCSDMASNTPWDA